MEKLERRPMMASAGGLEGRDGAAIMLLAHLLFASLHLAASSRLSRSLSGCTSTLFCSPLILLLLLLLSLRSPDQEYEERRALAPPGTVRRGKAKHGDGRLTGAKRMDGWWVHHALEGWHTRRHTRLRRSRMMARGG
ncbi:hypothetical protein V8C44DRAFT_333681, partial [Trichoderma aethiopicum]